MKKNVYLMYAIVLLQGMVFYGSIATLYRQAGGITISQITLIEGISLALMLLLEFPWGVVADKIGYRKTMIVCNVLYFLSKIIFWRADGFAGFLLERVLLSVLLAGLSGVDTSILYLSCDKSKSQQVFSIYNNLGMVGLLIATGIYSLLDTSNYRLAGFLTIIPYGVAMALSFALTEVKSEEKRQQFQMKESAAILKRKLTDKKLLMLLIAVGLVIETWHTIVVFLNQLQYVHVGMDNQQISIVYIIVSLSSLIGIFSAWGTKKLGKKMFGCMLLVLCVAACIWLTITKNPWISVVSILLLNISYYLFYPLQLELQNKAVVTDNRATELSINSVIASTISVFVTVVLGKVAERGVSYAMGFGAVLCVIALVLYYMSQRGKKSGEGEKSNIKRSVCK